MPRDPQALARAEQIYELYSDRGLSKRAIAKKLNLDIKTVRRHIERIEEAALQLLSTKVEAMKVRQTHQLMFVYREAVEGWERSKEDKVKRVHDWKDTTDGSETKQAITVEGQAGDPRFLATAMQAIQSLRELWGLDAPAQMDVGFRVPADMTPGAARARAEAARVVYGELLSPVEQEMRMIGMGQTPAAQAVSPDPIADSLTPPAER